MDEVLISEGKSNDWIRIILQLDKIFKPRRYHIMKDLSYFSKSTGLVLSALAILSTTNNEGFAIARSI